MRIIGVLTVGGLAAAVVAEGAYIVSTNRKVEKLTRDLERLSVEGATPAAASRARFDDDGDDEAPSAGRRSLPPPRFVLPAAGVTAVAAAAASSGSGAGHLPLPAALDTPEARQQLRAYVAAAIEQERAAERDRRRSEREDFERRRLEETAQRLGLDGSQTDRFNEIMGNASEARRALREKIEAGGLRGPDIAREFAALRQSTEQQLAGVLRPDQMTTFRQMEPGPGAGRWWGGGPGPGPGGGWRGSGGLVPGGGAPPAP